MIGRIALVLIVALLPFSAIAEQSEPSPQQPAAENSQPSNQTEASPEELAQVATQLFAEGKTGLALIVVAELLKRPKPPMQALFIAAKLAEQRSDWKSATKFYRAMLARDPGVLRVRLDLALALLNSGKIEASQHHFERVLGEPDLPEAVRANVIRYLDHIDHLTFSQTLSFEMLGDSNVNQATASEAVLIGGRRFVLSPSARQQHGKGLGIFWQGLYRFGAERQFSLRGVAQHQNYPSANQYNLTYLTGFSGWTKQWQPGHSTTFEAGWHGAFYGGRDLFNGPAFRISDLYRYLSGWSFNPTFESKQLRYPDYPLRNGWQHWLTVDCSKAMAQGVLLNGGIGFGRNIASDPIYNFKSGSIKTGGSFELPLKLTGSLLLEYLQTRYDVRDPFFGVRRTEKKLTVEIGFTTLALGAAGFAPRFTFGHVNNRSNIDLYRYRRTYGKLAIVRDF